MRAAFAAVLGLLISLTTGVASAAPTLTPGHLGRVTPGYYTRLPDFTGRDANGNTVTYPATSAVWTSSDSSIASVSSDIGTSQVLGVSAGLATLTASFPDGAIGSLPVDVQEPSRMTLVRVVYKDIAPGLFRFKRLTFQLVDTFTGEYIAHVAVQVRVVPNGSGSWQVVCTVRTGELGKGTCRGDPRMRVRNIGAYFPGDTIHAPAGSEILV